LAKHRDNSLGKALFNSSQPNQLFSQKEITFPSPTFQLNPSSKLLPQPSEAYTSFKSSHQRELLQLFPFLSQAPPTTIFRIQNLLPKTTLIHTKLPDSLS